MKKKLLLLAAIAISFSLSSTAQTRTGFIAPEANDLSIVGSLGYQTNLERFGLDGQMRYNLNRNIRLAADLAFYFPKDKITGLDVMINGHYVFYFPQDRFSVYPLVGIGMQTNFYGKQTVTVNGVEMKTDSDTKTDFAFNLGGGISYYLNSKNFLNAEVKFMTGDNDNVAIMLGYGYKF